MRRPRLRRDLLRRLKECPLRPKDAAEPPPIDSAPAPDEPAPPPPWPAIAAPAAPASGLTPVSARCTRRTARYDDERRAQQRATGVNEVSSGPRNEASRGFARTWALEERLVHSPAGRGNRSVTTLPCSDRAEPMTQRLRLVARWRERARETFGPRGAASHLATFARTAGAQLVFEAANLTAQRRL